MTFITEKTIPWTPPTNSHVDNFRNEFERIYDNDIDLNERLNDFKDYAATLVAGIIQGELFINKSSNTLGIRTGRYEVNGKVIKLLSDLSLTFAANNYGNNVAENEHWYYTLLDENGLGQLQMAEGSLLLDNLSIDSVTDQTGGVARIQFRNSPDLSTISAGAVFFSDDLAGANAGYYAISGVDDANDWVEVSNNQVVDAPAVTNPVGTGRISTQLNDQYTPAPTFDALRQGYYIGDRRILGATYNDESAELLHQISYKNGEYKNDDLMSFGGDCYHANVNTHVGHFQYHTFSWGTSITYAHDVDLGDSFTINKTGLYACAMDCRTDASNSIYIIRNEIQHPGGGSQASRRNIMSLQQLDFASVTGSIIGMGSVWHLTEGDVVRVIVHHGTASRPAYFKMIRVS